MEEFLKLSEAEQEALLKRLILYALRKMAKLRFRGHRVGKGGAPPKGMEPEDFAVQSIEKLLDGTRTWNKAKNETLEEHLRDTIDSDISHFVDGIDNKRGKRILLGSSTECEFEVDIPDPLGDTPLKLVIDQEWQERFRAAAMKEIGDVELLVDIFECLEAEIAKPRDIANMLDIDVDEIYVAMRKLRRRLRKVEKKFAPKRQVKT